MADAVTVGISEARMVVGQGVLVSYGLGSCVGVCLYDEHIHLAGMVHILLPYQKDSINQENVYKFADSGIQMLFRNMLLKGAVPKSLVAKIAGGAEMFSNQHNAITIGKRNIEAVKSTLEMLHIPVCAEDTGRNYGRSIWFYAETGDLAIKTVKHGIRVI